MLYNSLYAEAHAEHVEAGIASGVSVVTKPFSFSGATGTGRRPTRGTGTNDFSGEGIRNEDSNLLGDNNCSSISRSAANVPIRNIRAFTVPPAKRANLEELEALYLACHASGQLDTMLRFIRQVGAEALAFEITGRDFSVKLLEFPPMLGDDAGSINAAAHLPLIDNLFAGFSSVFVRQLSCRAVEAVRRVKWSYAVRHRKWQPAVSSSDEFLLYTDELELDDEVFGEEKRFFSLNSIMNSF